jgi:hypothetical protein
MFMFRKLNPLVLFVILAVLGVAVYLILRMDARRQQGSMLRELVNADRQKTTSIVVIPRGMVEETITLENTDAGWMAGSQGKKYQANRETIDQIFRTISPMVPEQLVSRSKDAWPQFELTDAEGTRVKVYHGKRLAGDFVFGKLDFQSSMIQGQQRPKISTHVRLSGQDDVYTAEGFLGSAFPAAARHYRDQTVTNINEANISKISMSGQYSYELLREGDSWLLNGSNADSTNIAFYTSSLKLLKSNQFVEEEAEGWLTTPSHRVKIEMFNDLPVELLAYPADTTYKYFITSSQNPGAVFSGSHNGLFESIFFEPEYFFGTRIEPDSF